jgi:hypothetical protein
VATGEGVLHPLKKFYQLKKWCQKSEKISKPFFFWATKFFENYLKFLGLFLKIFHPCSNPSRAATGDDLQNINKHC